VSKAICILWFALPMNEELKGETLAIGTQVATTVCDSNEYSGETNADEN
jgi:hypothetical protein